MQSPIILNLEVILQAIYQSFLSYILHTNNHVIMETVSVANDLQVESLNIKKAALIFRAVNNKVRQQTLLLLHENKKMTVTSIYEKLRLEQSAASQHLAVLRKAGFVLTQREGKCIYYSVNYKRLLELSKISYQLLTNL